MQVPLYLFPLAKLAARCVALARPPYGTGCLEKTVLATLRCFLRQALPCYGDRLQCKRETSMAVCQAANV